MQAALRMTGTRAGARRLRRRGVILRNPSQDRWLRIPVEEKGQTTEAQRLRARGNGKDF